MCITPIQLKKDTLKTQLRDTYKMQQVPCGKCIDCKKARQNSWFVRLISEMRGSTSAHFVTLTYDDDTLPHSASWIPTLDYSDWQRCVKRLRKNHKTEKAIKYFLVGEYGETTQRPHYHAIIFNLQNPENLEKEWHYGYVHVGEVTEASIFYTLKYCLKSITNEPQIIDRKPEKALISKKIGLNYLTPQMVKYYKNDVSRSVTMLGNKKTALPRYYRDKIFTEKEKIIRVAKMEILIKEKYEDTIHPLYVQYQEKRVNDVKTALKKTD